MIIAPSLKTIFVHSQKTGGTSITKLLAPYTDPSLRNPDPRLDGPGFQNTWHFMGRQHAKFAQDFHRLPQHIKEDFPSYRVLFVVRDPFSWVHSNFKEFYERPQDHEWSHNTIFGDFCRARGLTRDILAFCSFSTVLGDAFPNFPGIATQYSFVRGVPIDQLDIIHFENLPDDVSAWARKREVAFDSMPHELNQGPNKKTDFLQAKELDQFRTHVRRRFEMDFDLFGYDPGRP